MKQSAEGAALRNYCEIVAVHLSLALCRTFGASFFVFAFPDLTVGPILCRAFGPAGSSSRQILSFETASPDPSCPGVTPGHC
ncbi:MAG: hypothetical protein H6Q07_3041 [Acidobacteria bacterium]|nr:hypothetical protein [Acidobacteriota bacterium]